MIKKNVQNLQQNKKNAEVQNSDETNSGIDTQKQETMKEKDKHLQHNKQKVARIRKVEKCNICETLQTNIWQHMMKSHTENVIMDVLEGNMRPQKKSTSNTCPVKIH